VSGFFAFLQARGDVLANAVPRGLPTRRAVSRPRQGVPLVRVTRRLPRILSPAEVDALIAALRTHRDRAMVAAMVLGGLRRCEVLGLRLEDLRAAERRVFIAEGKGGRQRLIPVSGRFFAAVAAYLDAERPADAGTDRVFVVLKGPRRGQPLSAKGTDEVLTAARRRAGLDHATCHELRHTCLTRLQMSRIASDASFSSLRDQALPAVQRAALSQPRGNESPFTMPELGCHHALASARTMLHPVRLQPTPACCSWHNQKAQRQGQTPQPLVRPADVFSRVGTLLPTSFNRGMSLEAIAALLGHRSLDMAALCEDRQTDRRRWVLRRQREGRGALRAARPAARRCCRTEDGPAAPRAPPDARQRLLHPTA